MTGPSRPRLLFVCVENANRSQVAEAFARMHAADVVEPFSAGSRPSGVIKPIAIAAMAERGYDLTTHASKSLADVPQGPYEYVVTMGCGDACPLIPAAHREDWPLPDPKDMSPAEFVKVRDDIERRVVDLIGRIRADRDGKGADYRPVPGVRTSNAQRGRSTRAHCCCLRRMSGAFAQSDRSA